MILQLFDAANVVRALESTPEQRRFSVSWARSDAAWMKGAVTPLVEKLTADTIPNSKAWWTKTFELTNQFVSLLETLADRLDRGVEDAKTLSACKKLGAVEKALAKRKSRLDAVLDRPGLGEGTLPSELKRPDVAKIESDLRQIAATYRRICAGMLLDRRGTWHEARAILRRLNVRIGNPQECPLHWRAGLDVAEADSRWLDAVGAFVESANMSFENNSLSNDDIHYMAGVLQREAEHALESFGNAAAEGQRTTPDALRPTTTDSGVKPTSRSDTSKKSQKLSKPRMPDAHCKACIREFKEYLRIGEPRSMLDIVKDYVAQHQGVSQAGLYRRLNDNSVQWKPKDR